jgi:hypothetical protein
VVLLTASEFERLELFGAHIHHVLLPGRGRQNTNPATATG